MNKWFQMLIALAIFMGLLLAFRALGIQQEVFYIVGVMTTSAGLLRLVERVTD